MNELKWRLVGMLGRGFIDLLFFTTKIEVIGYEPVKEIFSSQKYIGAVWHSRILMFSYLYKHRDAVVLVSQSHDGEIIARILQRQGYETIRGSTTRGGLRALAKLIRCLKERDRPAAIIPDGPQGPRFRVQPGIITLAKKTGYPITPITYSAEKAKFFDSWDRFMLPYPFTRCRVIYGNPVWVPGDADKETEEICRTQLEDELCRITAEADGFIKRLSEGL